MNDQEMQFADPDWKPTRPLKAGSGAPEPEIYAPQPINIDAHEQTLREAAFPPRQEEGYLGLGPQVPPTQRGTYHAPGSYMNVPPQQVPYNAPQYRRRGRSPWFWIILGIIIISLMSGGFGSFRSGSFSGPNFHREFAVPAGNTANEQQIFSVGAQPTIIINDSNGNVQVQTGGKAGTVSVQATKQTDGPGNPNDIQPSYSESADHGTVTINFYGGDGSVDFDVTVPDGSNLQLTTNSGNIDVYLPVDTAFHVDATATSGSIDTGGFTGINVQDNGSGSEMANGNVGNSPQTTLTLTSDDGSINLHQVS